MPHVFAILADVVPEAREVYPHIARFLDAAQDLLPDQEVAAQDLLARDVPDQGLAAQDLVASDLAVSDLPAPGLPGEDVSALRIPPVQSGSTAA